MIYKINYTDKQGYPMEQFGTLDEDDKSKDYLIFDGRKIKRSFKPILKQVL